MKKIVKLLFAPAALITATGCYEDKGNYDYISVNPITITLDEEENVLNAYIGDLIEINPEITFADGQGDMDQLEYKWFIYAPTMPGEYTQEDWNKKNFSWVADREVDYRYDLMLQVTDKKTNLQYFKSINLRVSSPYVNNGVLVLSEKNGKTLYSFIKYTRTAYDPELASKLLDFKEYVGLYEQQNNEPLPDGPISIHTHFCTDDAAVGQMLVLTENGAVDINGKDFKKEMTIQEVFDGQSYPAGMTHVADAMFMSWIDLVTDSEGHIYSRMKTTNELFHSGFFLHDRLTMDGEELSDCRFITAPIPWFNACLVHDNNKKRLLIISDGGTGDYFDPALANAGKPMTIPYNGDAETLPPNFVWNDLSGVNVLHIGFNRNGNWSRKGYTLIFEKEGNIYWEDFIIEKGDDVADYGMTDPICMQIEGLPSGSPSCILVQPYASNNPYIYFAYGKDLYIYEAGATGATFYGSFRADIVAMDAENYNSNYLALALSDGSIIIQNAIRCAYDKFKVVYYDSKREMETIDLPADSDPAEWKEKDPIDLGNIKAIRWKVTTGNDWT